ncbi:spore germination protein [Halobacillus dabanensis]|uniref:Spore germination protein n=1 Tax=Halobacillus dabanensis TaxID=240302 RepID=A0A1I3YRB1_HALDA|nr:Ger(x)C family spore germination protein [Halobacillus dabanensis]SFK33791.1 spore germination protein [Halobacillus dabanensis]
MKRLAILSISTLLFLTSCFLQEEIVDDISMVTVIGFDKGEGEKILATINVPFHQSNIEVINKTYQTEAVFTKDATDIGTSKSDTPMVIAQNEVLIFSKELAEENLMDYLDSYQRDPSISTRLFVAVAEDKSAPLIARNNSINQDIGVLIGKMFRNNIERNFLPQTNLHLFLYDYYQPGRDPFLPIISKDEEQYQVKGISFFKGATYKGEIEFGYETMVFRQLRESFSHGAYTFETKDQEWASIQNVSSKKSVDVVLPPGEKPTIKINVKMNGFLREYSGEKIEEKTIKEISKQMEDSIKEKSTELLGMFEEWGVDPLGLGNEIRKNKRGWKEKEWEPIYEKVNVDVNINVTIKETGVTS